MKNIHSQHWVLNTNRMRCTWIPFEFDNLLSFYFILNVFFFYVVVKSHSIFFSSLTRSCVCVWEWVHDLDHNECLFHNNQKEKNGNSNNECNNNDCRKRLCCMPPMHQSKLLIQHTSKWFQSYLLIICAHTHTVCTWFTHSFSLSMFFLRDHLWCWK